MNAPPCQINRKQVLGYLNEAGELIVRDAQVCGPQLLALVCAAKRAREPQVKVAA